VSFATITPCVASQRAFIFVSVYSFIDSIRKLLDTPSYFMLLAAFELVILMFEQPKTVHEASVIGNCLYCERTLNTADTGVRKYNCESTATS
jgi:hypothetical protein